MAFTSESSLVAVVPSAPMACRPLRLSDGGVRPTIVAVPMAPSAGVDGRGNDEEDREGCMSSSGSASSLDADTPPGVEGVEDKARSSAMADSWSALTDEEKITPRRVGEAGAGDGGAKATCTGTSACANSSS